MMNEEQTAVAEPTMQAETPAPFQVGDVVTLNSGSPRMTVLAVVPEGITCMWTEAPSGFYGFGSGRSTMQQRFPAACLTKAT